MARSDHVRLCRGVVPRGSTRAVGRNHVVEPSSGLARVDGADSNRRRCVPWRRDPPVARDACCGVGSEVSCGGDNNDTRPDRGFDSLYQGIAVARLVYRMTQSQIDDVDLQAIWVLNRELNRVNHVAGQTSTMAIQHLQADDARLRCDAAIDANLDFVRVAITGDRFDLLLRGLTGATDQPGNVCPVTIIVEWPNMFGTAVCEKVLFVAFAAVQIRSPLQSGIDDRNADAFPAGSIVVQRIETECLEERTRSELTCRIDDCVGGHDCV